MTGLQLTPRDQRALLIGAGAIVLLLALGRGLPAWLRWRAAARAAAGEALANASRADATLTRFAESLDSLETRSARLRLAGEGLLVGDTPSEASSKLAALVAELARIAVIRLDAVESRPVTDSPGVLQRVTMDVQATADITGLTRFLASFEAGPTMLAVRRLAVRPRRVDGPADQAESLAVHVTVEALALVRPVAVPAPPHAHRP
jgi:hypothetical protein